MFKAHYEPVANLACSGFERAIRYLDSRMCWLIFTSLILTSDLEASNDLETNQIQQVLRTPLSMALYCQKEECKDHMACRALVYVDLTIGYINDESYTQNPFDTVSANSLFSQGAVLTNSIRVANDVPSALIFR